MEVDLDKFQDVYSSIKSVPSRTNNGEI